MTEIVIKSQFRGPPQSGNGGYVCGLLAKQIDGPATVVLRALIPLDTPLILRNDQDTVRLKDRAGNLIAEGTRAVLHLPSRIRSRGRRTLPRG